MADPLSLWNDGDSRSAIVDFVGNAARDVAPEERIAVFDNDGTLWCEKPMPIQLDFILRRLVEMADADPELRERQPWKAAYERDYAWLGARGQHYAGDDTTSRCTLAGILAAYAGMSVEDFEAQVGRVPARRPASHPRSRVPAMRLPADGRAARATWRRTGSPTTSRPAAGATSCGRSARRSTGSRGSGSSAAAPRSRTRATTAAARSPHSCAGVSRRRAAETDPHLEPGGPPAAAGRRQLERRRPDAAYTQHEDKPSMRLLVLHDDGEREFDYTAGAEQALERADPPAGPSSASRTTGPPSSTPDRTHRA